MATSPGSPVCPLLLQHACIYKHTHSHTHICSIACAHTMVQPNHTMFMSPNLLILSCLWAFVKALLSAWNALSLLQRDDCYQLSTLSLMSSPLGSFCGIPSLRWMPFLPLPQHPDFWHCSSQGASCNRLFISSLPH